ncbi:hypothetical protein ACVWZX_002167 [Deinococcus sp. UYEF24]
MGTGFSSYSSAVGLTRYLTATLEVFMRLPLP